MFKKVTLGLVAISMLGTVSFAKGPVERPVEKDVKENKAVIEKGVKGSEPLRQDLHRLVPAKEVKALGTGSVESKGTEKANTDVVSKKSTETIIKSSASEGMKDVVAKDSKLSKEEAIAKMYGKENAELIRDLSPENKEIAETVAVAARKKARSEDKITMTEAQDLVDVAAQSPRVLGGENAIGEKGAAQCLELDAKAVSNYAGAQKSALVEVKANDSGKAEANADRWVGSAGKKLAEEIGLKGKEKEGTERFCQLIPSCPGLVGKPLVAACARRGL